MSHHDEELRRMAKLLVESLDRCPPDVEARIGFVTGFLVAACEVLTRVAREKRKEQVSS